MSVGALDGCRILDLGIITAGAATSALLADMGAEVIKIESPNYRDPFRLWIAGDAGQASDAMPPFFRSTNRNKLGLSIDLKRAEGRAAFLRLVAQSDVVVENFRRGVLKHLGIDYEVLKATNPAIILASISSHGETGPDAGHVSYGTTLEAVGGLAWITGYAGGEPVVSGRDLNYPDQVAAIFSAGMIATAWRGARSGAGGVHLDISQRELTTFLCSEAFLAAETAEPRAGNAQAPHALQDCFRARDGLWVAITVDDGDVAGLGRMLPGADEPGAPEAGLGARLEAWIGERPAADAAAALSAAGVAAAVALDGRTMLVHRGGLWDMALAQAADGELLKGFPFQLTEAPLAIRRDAPVVGADSAEVLMRIGGYDAAEIAALAAAGVIELGPR